MHKKLITNKNTDSQANWLKAAVLGSNDGIISVAGLVVGVAQASGSKEAILTAGIAGIVAGAISLGAGEFVSVRTQRDIEEVILDKERIDLAKHPKREMEDLVEIYKEEGLKPDVAKTVAEEFTEADAFTAHAEAEFHINPKHLTNPWSSVFASSISFSIGSLIPLFAIILSPQKYATLIAFIAVVIALILTGLLTAKITGAKKFKSTFRVVAGGVIAMSVTYFVGSLFSI